MSAVIELPRTSFWAKRKKQPPVRQPNDASRSREYLMADEVKPMIAAARRSHDRLAEPDALITSLLTLISCEYHNGIYMIS
jgi:hypothetical protein